MEVQWDTAFGGCIHAAQIAVTTMQPYLCGCLMQAAGQPCIDPSWPVPDNLLTTMIISKYPRGLLWA